MPADANISIADLLHRMEADHKLAQRRARRRLAVLGFLILFVLGYMSWIYSNIAAMDAESVALIARGYLQSRMPDMEKELRTGLVEQAPMVADAAREALLGAPRVLRREIESSLPLGAQALAGIIEQELDHHLDTAMHGIALMVQQRRTKDSPPVTVQELVDDARAVYKGMLETILSDGFKQYAFGVRKLNEQLLRLRNGRNLTEREKLEREIVQASLAMMDKFHITDSFTPEDDPEHMLTPSILFEPLSEF